MASLRNAVPRREHRERSQLASRERYGLLEKKKDYKLRAKDYHRKQDRLKALRERAALKNPDEFYFGMVHGKAGKASDGVPPRTAEESKLASERDLAYVYTKAAVDSKKADKMKAQLHFLQNYDDPTTRLNTHTIFVDEEAEALDYEVEPQRSVKTSKEHLGRLFNVPRVEDVRSSKYELQSSGQGSLTQAHKEKAKLYRNLGERLKRSERLKSLALSIEMEKSLKGKGAKKKIIERDPRTQEPAVYKWRKQRKR